MLLPAQLLTPGLSAAAIAALLMPSLLLPWVAFLQPAASLLWATPPALELVISQTSNDSSYMQQHDAVTTADMLRRRQVCECYLQRAPVLRLRTSMSLRIRRELRHLHATCNQSH